jgi:hypothetical protein
MDTGTPNGKPTTRDVWMRGLFMLLFIAAFAAGQALLTLLTFVQFIWLLFAREPNPNLATFGHSLSIWLAEVGHFLTCGTDDKPFPWRAWPDASAPPTPTLIR